jgi:hypothetical protein
VSHLTAITNNSACMGAFEFRSLLVDPDGGQRVRQKFVENVDEALFEWIKEEQVLPRNRIFVGVCERSGADQGFPGRNVPLNSSLFFVDIDGTGQDASVKDLDKIIGISEGMGFDPLRVAHSGGGFHVYFEAERAMTSGERRATVQSMTYEFAADPRCPGRPDPAVCDAARMVGLWGTINGKYWDGWGNPGAEVSVMYEGSSTPVPVLAAVERVFRGITKIPEFEVGMNAKVYSLRLLLPIAQEFPSNEVLKVAARVINSNLPDSESGGCAEALSQCISTLARKTLMFPKKGGRRMWAYAKLASVVEAFPDPKVLNAAGEVIKGSMPGWVEEEPGQVDSIVESLGKERLC